MSEGGGGILRGSQEGGRRGDIEGVARREGGERCGGKGMMYMRDYTATMFYEPFLHYG